MVTASSGIATEAADGLHPAMEALKSTYSMAATGYEAVAATVLVNEAKEKGDEASHLTGGEFSFPSLLLCSLSLSLMGRLVNVHYMDKEAFLTNNADADEEAIVFDTSPSYDDLVAKVRHVLEWMDPNDCVKLIGRYDVEVGAKSRLKTLPITSNLHWDVYKEKNSQSEDKSLELFATKIEAPQFAIDLNRPVSSPMTERRSVPFVEDKIVIDASNAYSQPPTSQENKVDLYGPNACSQPPTSQANEVDVIATEKIIQEDGDVGDDDVDMNEVEEGFHGIDVGNLDAYIAQKDMDRELPFRRLYGYDSDDDSSGRIGRGWIHEGGKPNSLRVDRLEKITRLFRDLSLAHKAVVDGGMRNMTIEPTPCPDPSEPRDEDENENAYLKKGVKFLTLDDMKVWLSDYVIRNHGPFYVEHFDINLRFTVKCEKEDEGCP
ncbi:protease 2 [Hordeum vulgare]|nr:protease 2 [Hordeum vulgare]